MPLTGDFAALARLRRGMGQLASRGAREVSAAATAVAAAKIDQGFASGRSPDGAAWAATKSGNPPLRRTGALQASARPRDTGRGLRVRTSLPYAAVHQFGGRHTPARPYLPGETWPASWEREIERAALAAIEGLLR